MSAKEGNDYPIRRQISIQVSSSNNDPNNNNNERQFTTKDGGCTDRQKKKQPTNNPSSMYVKFDKKKRDEVLCWCHSALFLLALGTCVVSFTVPLLRKSRPRGIAMWQWSLLVTVLLGGPLLSKAIVRFVLFFLDREFSAKENIIYYVAGLIESAWVVLWFSMILVAWLIVVDEPDYLGVSRDENEKIVKKFTTTYPIINVTLVNFILGSFLWLLKELALMTAKSSFHIRRFFDRIREALMHQCIIESLSCIDGNKTLAEKKDVVMSVGKKKVFQKRRFGRKNKIFFDVTCLDEVTQEDVSCWGMKIVIDWIMVNQYLAYYDKTNNNRFKEIDCEYEAIHAADLIFSSLVRARDPNPIIGSEELKKHFPEEKVYEVKKCLLKGADSNQIEKEVFKKWMVKVYRYRSALVRALQANKTLFKAFNRFINVLLVFFIFALWLIMLRVETRKVIYVIATAIVGSAFVFGEPCRKMFENLLFVFLVHPFDIGDCCLIDNTPLHS